MTALVCAKVVATGSILCLVKWRSFISSSLDQVQGHKASGSFCKLHANHAYINNSNKRALMRMSRSPTCATVSAQRRRFPFPIRIKSTLDCCIVIFEDGLASQMRIVLHLSLYHVLFRHVAVYILRVSVRHDCSNFFATCTS